MAGLEPDGPDPDDWFADGPGRVRPPSPSGIGRRVQRLDRTPLVVTAALIVVLLAALAIAGVFSSGGGHPAASATTNVTTTTVPPVRKPPTAAGPAALRPPTSTLKPGARGTQVRVLQRSLVRLGYQVGKVDGRYGPKTSTALEAFQTATGLKADGVLGPKTLAALARALRRHAPAGSGSG